MNRPENRETCREIQSNVLTTLFPVRLLFAFHYLLTPVIKSNFS